MTATRPICVLIGALGGQGGGVLADWIVEAARSAGLPAQATSIPGVAQRTGATTYYFELFPEADPPEAPIFSLYPGAGDVDLVAALEPTEAVRALERGYVTENTTVVTVAERTYSTAEKVSAGDGTIAIEPLLETLRAVARGTIALPMSSLTAGKANQANAILLGAMMKTGVLPIPPDAIRNAIEAKGVAVEMNLSGLEIGLTAARDEQHAAAADRPKSYHQPPPSFEQRIAPFPQHLHALIGHGVARLVDYQDDAYADFYLDRLRGIEAIDSDPEKRLTEEVAMRLAAWMSFEDVIRVAQLKTRPGRLEKIRNDLDLPAGAPLRVRDYFSPGHAEISGFLPPLLARLVPKSDKAVSGTGWSIRWPTSSAPGFAALKLLGSLRWMRRRGSQYAAENAAIETWLKSIRLAAGHDLDLAVQTARLAIWARGYGRVRHEGLVKLDDLFRRFGDQLPEDPEAVRREVDTSLLLAHADPESPVPH